jgi:hypothetical protein
MIRQRAPDGLRPRSGGTPWPATIYWSFVAGQFAPPRGPIAGPSFSIPALVALPIPFHPQHDDAYKAAYWRVYIDHLRQSRF